MSPGGRNTHSHLRHPSFLSTLSPFVFYFSIPVFDPISSCRSIFSVVNVCQVLERSKGDDDDWENWGKESRAQRAPGSVLEAGDEEEKEPPGKEMTCTQGRREFSPVSLWCHYLAWTLCVLLSICCLVYSAALGNRSCTPII